MDPGPNRSGPGRPVTYPLRPAASMGPGFYKGPDMYFFKLKGKQFLDLRGVLILSHNDELVKARVATAAPRYVKNANYIVGITRLKPFRKLRATFAAIRFIWGPSQAIDPAKIDRENGLAPVVKRKTEVRLKKGLAVGPSTSLYPAIERKSPK